MIHKNVALSTSNTKKINEFRRFGFRSFEIKEGLDLKEVDGTLEEVIIHKTLDAGENVLVEDTVLIVNGKEIVDIRWKIEEISDLINPLIQWKTSLGVLDDGILYLYSATINCKLVDDAKKLIMPDDAFGFDPYLIPISDDNDKTFYELENIKMKDYYSPRKQAVENVVKGDFDKMIIAATVKKWTGNYQNS